MKNKIINKKAFTLVELLAVIAILALILTIVTPTVLSVIKKSESSTEKHSIELYGRAVKQAAIEYQIDGENSIGGYYKTSEDGKVLTNLATKTKLKIKYSGNKVNCSDIHITESAEVYLDNCKVNDKKIEFVYGEKMIEEPDLYDDTLTPVVYDGNDWRVASSTSNDWYDYEKQEWANAVILANNISKKEGDKLNLETEVLGMYVWIPRYEYMLGGTYGSGSTSPGTPGEIKVNFISKDETSPTKGYLVHPAFNFGGVELSGIWVGKFEVSYATAIDDSLNNVLNCSDESCENGDNLRVLPNQPSLRKNNISNFFYAIRSMSRTGNDFNINSSLTDTHMMKNSEWGAVAYLSQSKYGKYGNNDYKNKEKEVYINNSSGYYTGRSGGSYGGNTAINTVYTSQSSTAQYNTYGYYTYDGYLLDYNTNNKTRTRDMKKVASTTGNIYGIYDMSGSAYDYLMGVFANADGVLWTGKDTTTSNSGFTGKTGTSALDYVGLDWPNQKYYEVFKAYSGISISSITACNGIVCYGHALSETNYWYTDAAILNSAGIPWLARGGVYNNGVGSGVFNFDTHYGNPNNSSSTRIVLSANN